MRTKPLPAHPDHPSIHPCVVFKNHPEWPVYEAPARWYIQPRNERFGK